MKIDRVFLASFADSYPLCDEYLEVVYNYVVNGLHPGGMFSRIFANDVLMAACSSHSHNDWNQLQTLMKWIVRLAPPQCWGDHNKVDEWCRMDSEERRQILVNMRLLSTLFEVIKYA